MSQSRQVKTVSDVVCTLSIRIPTVLTWTAIPGSKAFTLFITFTSWLLQTWTFIISVFFIVTSSALRKSLPSCLMADFHNKSRCVLADYVLEQNISCCLIGWLLQVSSGHQWMKVVWRSELASRRCSSCSTGPMRTFICTAVSACVTGTAPPAALWVNCSGSCSAHRNTCSPLYKTQISQWLSERCKSLQKFQVPQGGSRVRFWLQKEVLEVLRGFLVPKEVLGVLRGFPWVFK